MSVGRTVRWLVAVAVGLLAATLLVAAPGPSRADDGSTPSADDAPVAARAARVGQQRPGQVLAYWTTRRMREALPLGLDQLGRVLTGAKASPRVAARSTTLTAPRSVGKLFFTDDAADYVCSAAAVNTATKNVIITAGHCASKSNCFLLSCRGTYFTNFLFVPRYANGSAPDGRWVGTQAITHQAWFDNENLAYDQALIKVANLNGRRLVDVVGGNGLAWNFPARENDIRVWGWPAEAPYDGETVRRCSGNTTRFDGGPDAALKCPLTGGASGGPWFLSMRSSSVGYVWAVTSRRTIGGTPLLLARPLTGAIRNLVAAANGSSASYDPRQGSGLDIPSSYAGPVRHRRGISLRAVPAHVGRGQLLEIRVKTAAHRRTVLQVRYSAHGAWHRVRRMTTSGAGTVAFRLRPQAVGKRWYRAYTSTRTSRAVAVRLHSCPLPLDRTSSVVRSTGCSAAIS